MTSEPAARTFSDYLYVNGIRNQVEAEADGTWAVWIHGEDELEQARSLLHGFLTNPEDASVKRASAQARELAEREEQEEAAAGKRRFDRDRLFPSGGWGANGPVTLTLIAVSILVYVVWDYTSLSGWTQYLFITELGFSATRELPEVREGQIWRLLTPIFLHFGVLHILFNMLWLRDLGAMIETRLSSLYLLLLVVVIGVSSNLAQYYATGYSQFGGMSGVVYGLLGFIWMKGKFDPGSGLFLHQSTVTMMLIWLVLGYTNVLGAVAGVQMANTVHTVGLGVGVVWGFIAARIRGN